MAILTDADFPEVRAVLHMSITTDHLPDATIGLPIYQGRAENEIIRRDPLAESRTESEGEKVRQATILLLAALIAPAMEMLTSETIPGGGYRYQKPEVDWKTKAQLLRESVDSILSVLLDTDPETPSLPFLFGRVTA